MVQYQIKFTLTHNYRNLQVNEQNEVPWVQETFIYERIHQHMVCKLQCNFVMLKCIKS